MKKLLFAVLVPLSMLYATQDIEQPISVNLSKYLQSFYDEAKKNETLELIRTSSEGKCAYDPKGELLCTITRPQLKSIIDRDEIKGLSILRYDTRATAGIGVTIERKNPTGAVTIKKVFEHSPALESGLVAGDAIYAIDRVDITAKNMEEIGDMLRGVHDSNITLSFEHRGERITKTMTRKTVWVWPSSNVLSKNTASITYALENFNRDTPAQLAKIIENHSKLTIDLRNSDGGLYSAIMETLSIFIPSGTEIFTTIQENGSAKELQRVPSTKLTRYNGDVEIIVDQTTRSGSLLFAYAMARYHPKTKITGNKSGTFSYLFEPLPLHYIDVEKNDSPILYLLKVPCGYFTTTENIMMSDKTLFDLLNNNHVNSPEKSQSSQQERP
ncbi:MAG: S41 family peptidase [Sulfuricurvum sp.]|nr:S41 family peptidase [Sulfuricurvum sp.]